MKMASILRMGSVSLAIIIAGRALYLQNENWQRERLTHEVCNLVDNYLETSAVRSAFEGMEQAIARTPYKGACITIIDSGKHYSPECIQPGVDYQLTLCKAIANRGIHAEIDYPKSSFLNVTVYCIWLCLWALMVLGLVLLRRGADYFTRRITEELKNRLFGESPEKMKEDTIGRVAHWLAVKTGVLQGVRVQTQKFEGQIREYESRVRTEAVLRAQKEIEVRKSQERIEEIEKIRHDLGSPLSSFLLVQESFVGDEFMRQRLASGIQKIQKMLDRLGKAQTDSDAARLTIVETVAEEAVALLSQKFQSVKAIDLSLEYDSSQLSPVSAASEGLMRILNNLLENAFDASSVGGAIRVRVESFEGACKISVEDNGCGVSPEIVPRLFEKGATFGKEGGTGYGLYQCKTTIESWKGTIVMEPLAQGTRFVITLPKLQAGVAFVGLPSTERLWVIDDDSSVAETLDQSGYAVIGSASTYAEGKALLEKPIPANVAVLVDYRLDGGTLGTDLIAGHKAMPQIYLCTNDFENPEVVKKARQIGVRIIPKPLCFLAEGRAGVVASDGG